MHCLTCGHVSNPDSEMAREQNSNACLCPCHPWNNYKGRLEVSAQFGMRCPTCKPECDPSCKGTCGCQACHDAYMDFLSVE